MNDPYRFGDGLSGQDNYRLRPRHVAVSADGNGRWARAQGLERSDGHLAGESSFRSFVECALTLHIEHLSFHVFTPQNFQRAAAEVEFIFDLLIDILSRAVPYFVDHGVRFSWAGNADGLPVSLLHALDEAELATAEADAIHVYWLINFGGRENLECAVSRIASDVAAARVRVEDVNGALLAGYLWQVPDVDLFIRSAGEQRLSNFSLWHLVYSELYFTDTMWPDMRGTDLIKAVRWFSTRNRALGGSREP